MRARTQSQNRRLFAMPTSGKGAGEL